MAIPTKQALLQALSDAEGHYISGEQLAQTLGVSRAAIHKAAAALTTQGYALEAAPRRGYRLLGGDPFCADAVGEYPAPVYVYERLDSSNQTAKRLALAGAPHGTLVLAGQQSAGRGRWAADSRARRARASIFLWCCGRPCPPPRRWASPSGPPWPWPGLCRSSAASSWASSGSTTSTIRAKRSAAS